MSLRTLQTHLNQWTLAKLAIITVTFVAYLTPVRHRPSASHIFNPAVEGTNISATLKVRKFRLRKLKSFAQIT